MTDKKEWLAKHAEELEPYTGKYIAVVDDWIAATSSDPGEAIDLAREAHPDKTSLLIYVPKEKEMEMLIWGS